MSTSPTAGRTTFVIAHRLATVVNATRILVLHQGRIAEMETHADLRSRDGCYAARGAAADARTPRE